MKLTYNRIWFQSWLWSEACSPIISLDEEGSTSRRADSTVSPEWLEALVKDVDMERSSSQVELELGFDCCHGLVLVHEESDAAWWRSHQFGGVEEEIATESSVHSSAILISKVAKMLYWNPLFLLSVGGGVNLRRINHISIGGDVRTFIGYMHQL
jgi:hypothetical protein